MGNTASDETGDHENNVDNLDPFDGSDTLGYRVLGVQPDSPAAAAGLVSFLDFLIGANGQMLLGSGDDLEEGEEYDDIDLPGLLQEHKGQEMEFLVWNIKSQKERLVTLIPNDTWGGAGLLGVTIRLDNYQGAEERMIRVLEVTPQSPAAMSGLVPDTDFLLGTTTQTLDSVKTLAVLLQQHQDKVLDLYVYNSKADMVRMVALYPTVSWADTNNSRPVGLLGAELGTGYLHRLPKAVTETVGASVQRKVRYVGTKETATGEGTSGNHKSNGGGGGGNGGDNHPNGLKSQAASAASSTNSFTTVNMSPTDPSKGTALVEVEPQLEMEAHESESEGEDDDNDNDDHVPQPAVQQEQKRRNKKVQPVAAARVAAAAAIAGGLKQKQQNVYNENNNYHHHHHSAEQLAELQQRLPPPPLEEVSLSPQFQHQPPLLPDQLRLSRSGSSSEGYPSNVQWNRSSYASAPRLGGGEEQHQQYQHQHQPPSPQQLQLSRSGSSDGQPYPNWNRSGHSVRSGDHSTDGESSIGNERPVRMASPVKMNRVKVASPPSSLPGAFTSVNAIFSKPPPKDHPAGSPEAPIQSSFPARYVKSGVPASLEASVQSTSPVGRVVPEQADFTSRATKSQSSLFPPPPMMHYVSQPASTNK